MDPSQQQQQPSSNTNKEYYDENGLPKYEELISYENKLREEIENTSPLVSEPLDVAVLTNEYQNTEYITSIVQIISKYKHIRTTRRDGNCFYRGYLFRRNFKNKFNSNINQTLKQQCKTSLNFKSQDNNPNQTTNDNNNNNNSHTTKLNTSNTDTTTLPKETTTTNNNNNTQPTLPKLNSFKSLSPSPSTSNSFNEPSTINTNYKRTRNFTPYTNPDYILTSKWKLKEGIYSTDIKYNKALSLDLSFQSKYIKDEIKLLIDNITYMRTNLLCTNDIITAIKNKNLQFQININKCIEETIAFINMINRIILKHKSDYYDDLLSHSNIKIKKEHYKQPSTT